MFWHVYHVFTVLWICVVSLVVVGLAILVCFDYGCLRVWLLLFVVLNCVLHVLWGCF